MPQIRFMTLSRFIIEQEKLHPEATGELSKLLHDLSLAAKVISLEVNKAGLADILGFTGDSNVHGEDVRKLDMFAHNMMFNAMDHGGHLCIMASEEEEDIIHIPAKFKVGKYVLLFDPLDGSSNIDANVSIGTIFSIFKRITPDGKPGTLKDCLQKGVRQVAAGYIVYESRVLEFLKKGKYTVLTKVIICTGIRDLKNISSGSRKKIMIPNALIHHVTSVLWLQIFTGICFTAVSICIRQIPETRTES